MATSPSSFDEYPTEAEWKAIDEQIMQEVLAEQDRILRLDRPEIFEEFRSGRCSEQVHQLLALRYPKAVLLNFAGRNPYIRRQVNFWAGEIPYVGYDANF